MNALWTFLGVWMISSGLLLAVKGRWRGNSVPKAVRK